jgi:hypothetical protein
MPSTPIEPARKLDHLSFRTAWLEAGQEDRDRHWRCTPHAARAEQSRCQATVSFAKSSA